ncbi:MAG: ASCH domain-containing protein [Sedimentisphaerales bacterium]|nr:ASCH domain-containing protein [Sedimentisphaerales bacterium]
MASHVAILQPKYLELLLSGEKKVECRLSRIKCAPYGRIVVGEPVWLKESSGPIRGRGVVTQVQYFEGLTPTKVRELHQRYNEHILGSEGFWSERRSARYATLIWLGGVRPVRPWRLPRRGLSAWVVYEDGQALGLQRASHA